MSLNLSVREIGEVTIIDSVGSINLGEGSYSLRTKIEELCAGGKKKIIINLAETSYVDSSGIGEIVAGLVRLKRAGGTLKLLAMEQKVRDFLQITNLYNNFDIFDDEKTAVASFR